MKRVLFLIPFLLSCFCSISLAQPPVRNFGPNGETYVPSQENSKDRDYGNIIATFQADSLTPNQYKIFILPQIVKPYKSLTLGVSVNSNFFAGADSDSVAMCIYPIGKETQNWQDGLDFYFDANVTDDFLTPFVVCRTGAPFSISGGWLQSTWPRYALTRRNFTTGGFVRGWAAMVPLYNNYNNPFQYPVLGLRIYNPLQRTITNINIDIHPKAN